MEFPEPEVYYVVADVGHTKWLTTVEAKSFYEAEHFILDQGICGKHDYAVTGCIAFNAESMKTDTFVSLAIQSYPVSFMELMDIISERNSEIREKDRKENIITENLRKIKELEKEIESCRVRIDEVTK